MTSKEKKKINTLVAAISSLNTKEEAWRFLRDLLTENELSEFANRWQAARMLEKKIPYTTIQKETGLSSATVARVSLWLNEGMDGYKNMISKLHHHTSSLREKRL